MWYSKFVAGVAVGLMIGALVCLFCYHFICFSIADGHYRSPIIAFTVVETDPNFERLKGSEYWQDWGERTESEIESFLNESGRFENTTKVRKEIRVIHITPLAAGSYSVTMLGETLS